MVSGSVSSIRFVLGEVFIPLATSQHRSQSMKRSYVTKCLAILKDLGRFDGDVVLQPKPGTVEGVDERLMELAGIKILYLPPSEKMEHALDASRKNT